MDAIIDKYPTKKYFNQYIYDKALENRSQLDPYYQEFVGNDWDNPLYDEDINDIAKRNKVYFYFLIRALLNKSSAIDFMFQYKPDGKQLDKDILSVILANRGIQIEMEDLQDIAENNKTVDIDDYFRKMFDNFKFHNSVDKNLEIRLLFLLLIKNEHLDSAKYLAGQIPIVKVLSTIKSSATLKALLDHPDIVSIIGKDAAQELRKGLVKLEPKKYLELQSQASVLKEIGGEQDYEKGEISRGTVHDHVIANILSGSISTFGLYNVMQAIENAPKNAYTYVEKRNWSVLRHLSKEEKIMLIFEIFGKLTTAQFVDVLDLTLRVLSNPDDETWKANPKMKLEYIQEYQNANVPFNMTTWAFFQMQHVFKQSYFILAIKSIVKSYKLTHPSIVKMKKYISDNYVYPLPGLKGLVVEIDKIGIEKWTKEKFPYVTQFQGYDMFAESAGDFHDFE